MPPLAEVDLEHPLHSAASPMLRALPDYERHFQHHLLTARAYWDVAQARLQRCGPGLAWVHRSNRRGCLRPPAGPMPTPCCAAAPAMPKGCTGIRRTMV